MFDSELVYVLNLGGGLLRFHGLVEGIFLGFGDLRHGLDMFRALSEVDLGSRPGHFKDKLQK